MTKKTDSPWGTPQGFLDDLDAFKRGTVTPLGYTIVSTPEPSGDSETITPPLVTQHAGRIADPNPLTGADWGYTCLVGLPHHGTSWLPKRFREPSKAALASLRQQLGKLTKAKLAAYIADRGGFADGRERKSDLVTAAVNKQMERLFPFRDPQPGDRDG